MAKKPGPGHNSTIGGDSQKRLQSYSDRLTRLDSEIADLRADRAEVLKAAKDDGFDTKILNKVVKRLQMDKVKRDEEDALIDLYMHAIQPDLFDAAA